MPAKENMIAGSVTERQNVPHMRKRRSGSSMTVNNNSQSISQPPYIEIKCGEVVAQGDCLSVGSDGKAYTSSNVAADNKPCKIFAIESGNTGDIIRAKGEGEVSVSATLVTGATVWLAASGAVTTTVPTYTAGNYIQKLGTSSNINAVILSIGEAYEAK